MKLSALVVAFILACGVPAHACSEEDSCRGTAIAAIRTQDEIVVAADSKAVGFSGASRSDAVCKIRKSVAGFYAVHGLSHDKRAGFNVFDILSAAGRSGGAIQDFAAEFERSAKEPLERAAERIRQYDRDQFKANFIDADPLGVIFFGVENGELIMLYRRFSVASPATAPVRMDIERFDCPGPGCSSSSAVDVFVGSEAFPFKAANPDYLKKNLVDVARSFVQQCIDRHGSDYGPPVDIVRVTRDRAEWVQRKRGCP